MSERSIRGLALHLVLGVAVVSLTGVAVSSSSVRTVRIEDRCDPATFNAVLGDGACVGDGEETFDEFIAELEATREARHWRFKEDDFDVRVGEAINTFNIGGEAHTFTNVAQFGGGFVPELNALSGAGGIVPECIPVVNEAGQFVSPGPLLEFPGQSGADRTLTRTGVERFQCCIHPWMRTEVTVRRR